MTTFKLEVIKFDEPKRVMPLGYEVNNEMRDMVNRNEWDNFEMLYNAIEEQNNSAGFTYFNMVRSEVEETICEMIRTAIRNGKGKR